MTPEEVMLANRNEALEALYELDGCASLREIELLMRSNGCENVSLASIYYAFDGLPDLIDLEERPEQQHAPYFPDATATITDEALVLNLIYDEGVHGRDADVE